MCVCNLDLKKSLSLSFFFLHKELYLIGNEIIASVLQSGVTHPLA